MLNSRESNSAYWALRIAFGFIPLIAGLDKFTHILTDWNQYLNPNVLRVVPLTATGFMQIVGVVEIAVGIAILFGATRWFGYVAMLWLFGKQKGLPELRLLRSCKGSGRSDIQKLCTVALRLVLFV